MLDDDDGDDDDIGGGLVVVELMSLMGVVSTRFCHVLIMCLTTWLLGPRRIGA